MSTDFIVILVLSWIAMCAFKDGGANGLIGWFLVTMLLYGIVKTITLLSIMAFTEEFVFPIPSEEGYIYLHLPGVIIPTLVVGVLYFWCGWRIERREA